MITSEQLLQLKSILSNRVSTDPLDIAKHSSNHFYISNFPPDAICYPESESEILKIVDFCIQNNIPLIPYGSGTSVEGHTAAIHGGLCIDMSKMCNLLEINTEDSYVRVQAGIPYNVLNEILDKYGFHFPVEAGWGASIGGMVATNASGAGATDAGSMSKNVKSCGIISYKHNKSIKINTATYAPKSSAGYNLTSLFVGSEGTLGIITEVTLQIRRNFSSSKTVCCQFSDIDHAIRFVIAMKGIIQFRRVELMDKLQTKACAIYSNIKFLKTDLHTVIIELGGTEGSVDEQVNLICEYLKKNSVDNIQIFSEQSKIKEVWTMRKNACPAAIQLMNTAKKAIATDVSVPISKLAECINTCYKHMNDLKIEAPLVAHIGDGNFHFTILVDPSNSFELKSAKQFNKKIVDEAIRLGGSCTGEHGIGLGKMSYLQEQHKDSIFIMESIKKALDPRNIFNPGKIIHLKKNFFCRHGDFVGFTGPQTVSPGLIPSKI